VESALKPFRVLAYVVGVMLLILCVAMVMRYGFGSAGLSKTIAPIHGGLYMLYLVAVMNLGMKARWSWPYMLGVMLGGTVPFLSFFVERKVRERVAGQSTAGQSTAEA
jgi:integral membrane protein